MDRSAQLLNESAEDLSQLILSLGIADPQNEIKPGKRTVGAEPYKIDSEVEEGQLTPRLSPRTLELADGLSEITSEKRKVEADAHGSDSEEEDGRSTPRQSAQTPRNVGRTKKSKRREKEPELNPCAMEELDSLWDSVMRGELNMGNFFDKFGVMLLKGNIFLPDDDHPGLFEAGASGEEKDWIPEPSS